MLSAMVLNDKYVADSPHGAGAGSHDKYAQIGIFCELVQDAFALRR